MVYLKNEIREDCIIGGECRYCILAFICYQSNDILFFGSLFINPRRVNKKK